ncbi:MAG: hypothetical protein D6B28_02320 [Gammaproteobacteria bacterium]|nr:MAG: hypothetical protein D6B28_02320 [Gammaproteobacteria bacterium]
MNIYQHAAHTKKLFGVHALDIHKWIDQYFSKWKYVLLKITEIKEIYNPYEHRKYLHHKEALPLVLKEFEEKYPPEIIKKVFLQHLKDDYQGYIPDKKDHDDPEFIKKYHPW